MGDRIVVRKPQRHKKALSRGDELAETLISEGKSGVVTVVIEVHCGGVRRGTAEQRIFDEY